MSYVYVPIGLGDPHYRSENSSIHPHPTVVSPQSFRRNKYKKIRNRRRYLSLTTVGAVSIVCGCLSDELLESETTVQLAGVIVGNYSEVQRTVDVRVLEGESELESSKFEFESGEHGDDWVVANSESVPCKWSSEPKQFVVEARLEDNWKTVNVEERAETDCAAVMVRIDVPGFTGLSLRVTDCDYLDTDSEVLCPFVASE